MRASVTLGEIREFSISVGRLKLSSALMGLNSAPSVAMHLWAGQEWGPPLSEIGNHAAVTGKSKGQGREVQQAAWLQQSAKALP